MALKVKCPDCLKAIPYSAGQSVACPNCGCPVNMPLEKDLPTKYRKIHQEAGQPTTPPELRVAGKVPAAEGFGEIYELERPPQPPTPPTCPMANRLSSSSFDPRVRVQNSGKSRKKRKTPISETLIMLLLTILIFPGAFLLFGVAQNAWGLVFAEKATVFYELQAIIATAGYIIAMLLLGVIKVLQWILKELRRGD